MLEMLVQLIDAQCSLAHPSHPYHSTTGNSGGMVAYCTRSFTRSTVGLKVVMAVVVVVALSTPTQKNVNEWVRNVVYMFKGLHVHGNDGVYSILDSVSITTLLNYYFINFEYYYSYYVYSIYLNFNSSHV